MAVKPRPQPTLFESQNWFGDLVIVVTIDPLAIVPVTTVLLTGIDVAPNAAPADVTVKAWPAIVAADPPVTAATSAVTGMPLTLPARRALVPPRAAPPPARNPFLTTPPPPPTPPFPS